ncbi:DgyrCDS319 [Dimorphilus gyrociliatus]|uniref:DgyrCDS319 n=1 Tax=Dimorphilus gyrociliatus TaxID=2664684 RepID=A0A7I8V4E5_9ANNE|nr:DgyrCDS319 [Dimorphilus gyrociliatus]
MDLPEDLSCPQCKNLLSHPMQLRYQPSPKSSLIVSIKLTLLNDNDPLLRERVKTADITCPKCLDQSTINYKPNSQEKFYDQPTLTRNNELESVIKTFEDAQRKFSLSYKELNDDFCKFHQMERMKLVLYCTVCKEDICHRCAIDGHHSHTVISLYLKNVYETNFCQIQPVKNNIKTFKESLTEKMIRAESIKKREHIEFTNYLTNVELEFQSLIKCLKAKHLEILSRLKNERQVKFLQNSNAVSCFRSKIDELAKVEEDLEKLENGATHVNLKSTLELGEKALLDWNSPDISDSKVSKHLVEALQTIGDMIENLTFGDEDINHNTPLENPSPVQARSGRKRRSCSRALEMNSNVCSSSFDK